LEKLLKVGESSKSGRERDMEVEVEVEVGAREESCPPPAA
jgi:hypothetical protein